MSLRDHAREILSATLAAASARRAVREALRHEGDRLFVAGEEIELAGRLWLLGAGKAAAAMAEGVRDALGDRIDGGTITTKHRHARPLPGLDVWEAGHPLPDAAGLAGAAEALHLARAAEEDDVVLCLLSGGASALWPAPPAAVSLSDIQQVTRDLLRAGTPIGKLNAVRKHLSRLSGGQLARAAWPARTVALVVSDVVGSAPEVIASGPTVADPSTYAEALAVLERRGVDASTAVLRHLRAGAAGEREETPKPGDPRLDRSLLHVVADNGMALDAAARAAEAQGYAVRVVDSAMEGEARNLGVEIATAARHARAEARPVALLWGGESTVTVRGEGMGGRNQEMALAAALALEGESGIVVACLGTDGTDGPTDAAGARVDGGTVARGREAGLDARDHLERNDAHPFLRATGDLLVTGPTGTHVNDVVVALVGVPSGGGAGS